ncbi:Dynein regulatory complex subunit 7 [Dissostichus eleginoides]|uniref:Dynein regulatory complex subunit 7 n=1 Tax=Dissostichus eleginoides TaxID=100907 RepID=A0AAD9B965_DISEL|nr:Dynein regulatory complex subunit 7 [Dissostichus eleginoides]
MKTLLLASALFAGLFVSLTAVPVPDPAPAPYHAFCKTMLFAGPCTDIKTMLVTQILASSPEYTLVSVVPGFVKANHTSPKTPEGESIIISLNPTILTGGCRMSALSTSNGFTSLFDGGQNYCNLYNLVSASGLMKEPGFMEITNEWACLGYGLATCS